MKFNQLALAAVAGAVLATSASADQVFHIYGSTAYRKATFQALNGLYATGTIQVDANNLSVSTVSLPIAAPTSAELGSTNMIWKGTMPTVFGSQIITIYANWAGSVGGIRSIADPSFGQENAYLTDGGPYDASHYTSGTVDLAMSDCDQLSTRFNPTVDSTMNPLSETLVCVLEFIWTKGNGGPANLTDVNPWSIGALLSLGDVPVSQFTGISSDSTNLVYAIGRSDDSGTRIMALVDSFYGYSTPVIQYLCPNGSPATYSFVYAGAGDAFDGDGYSSGGSVKTAMTTTRPASYKADGVHESYMMGYVGMLDAMNVGGFSLPAGSNTLASVTSPAIPTSQWLSYSGIPWSEPAITEGAYTYFSYEHLDTAASPTAAVSSFATALAAKQMAQAGSSLVPGTMPISIMNIANRADGSIIAHN